MRLRDEAYYYLRPWCWVHYSLHNRTDACKFARIALRKLGYSDGDEAWEYLRQQPGWVDPWKNTPEGALYYREKEEKKSKGDHEKRKAEALANPAPMLTSTIRPGFFSTKPDVTKTKKATKEKEPKVKKEKTSVKKESDRDAGAQPKLSQASSSASTSTPAVEPTVQEVELGRRQNGPGSSGGKLAVAKRFQREKQEGFASSVSTPSRSPRPLPTTVSTGGKAESRKRKVEDDDYQEGPAKKRKLPLPPVPSSSEPANRGVLPKKRKGGDIEALSPPSKVRKGDPPSNHSQRPSTSSAYDTSKQASVSRKAESATRNYNGRRPNGRESWDYSSDDDATPPPHALKHNAARRDDPRNNRGSSRSTLAVPHRVAPPTTYLGFKAVFMQKWGEYGMLCGIIMGEEAKLQNIVPGDDSATLMGVDELKSLLRKRKDLETELKELKVEIARLAAKGS